MNRQNEGNSYKKLTNTTRCCNIWQNETRWQTRTELMLNCLSSNCELLKHRNPTLNNVQQLCPETKRCKQLCKGDQGAREQTFTWWWDYYQWLSQFYLRTQTWHLWDGIQDDKVYSLKQNGILPNNYWNQSLALLKLSALLYSSLLMTLHLVLRCEKGTLLAKQVLSSQHAMQEQNSSCDKNFNSLWTKIIQCKLYLEGCHKLLRTRFFFN